LSFGGGGSVLRGSGGAVGFGGSAGSADGVVDAPGGVAGGAVAQPPSASATAAANGVEF
jgi:hypothetical protein